MSPRLIAGAVLGAVVVSFLLAFGLRAFVLGRRSSAYNACVNNLRQIESAKQQWALQHGAGSNDVPTMSDPRPYQAWTEQAK